MMRFFNSIKLLVLGVVLVCSAACSSGNSSGKFIDPTALAVDSTNDRLFAVQPRGEILAYSASSLDNLTDQQPAIKDDGDDEIDTEDAISQALPQYISHLGVFASGTTSRLFMLGMTTTATFDVVLNQIAVMDFDGTSFTEASFSPIILDDQNGTADDEDDNSFSDMVIDQANSRLYVSDASAGLLYIYSTADGTAVQAPIAIGGTPRGMWLAGDDLYVCNSSADDAEQVVSRISTVDFTENEIDLGVPCDEVAAITTSAGTVLMARNSDLGSVLILTLDKDTGVTTNIPVAATSDGNDGGVAGGNGITSVVNDIVLTADSSGVLYAYLSETDGNVEFITIQADFSSYAEETLSTLSLDMNDGALLVNTSGLGVSAYFVAGSGSLVDIPAGSNDANLTN